jgi:hypothetical protein
VHRWLGSVSQRSPWAVEPPVTEQLETSLRLLWVQWAETLGVGPSICENFVLAGGLPTALGPGLQGKPQALLGRLAEVTIDFADKRTRAEPREDRLSLQEIERSKSALSTSRVR